ncbi:hypothetical protein [Arhodomonas aquaeolei]|uniref:hypothetical protein n=1 Tax=Arhodomonas aquaeolei TaxID=2369 RepID=UPI000372AE75|nr:hypothetical protein [Arhodomonas aquaeolei]
MRLRTLTLIAAAAALGIGAAVASPRADAREYVESGVTIHFGYRDPAPYYGDYRGWFNRHDGYRYRDRHHHRGRHFAPPAFRHHGGPPGLRHKFGYREDHDRYGRGFGGRNDWDDGHDRHRRHKRID